MHYGSSITGRDIRPLLRPPLLQFEFWRVIVDEFQELNDASARSNTARSAAQDRSNDQPWRRALVGQ